MRALVTITIIGLLASWSAQAAAENSDEYERTIRAAVTEFEAGGWQEARVLFMRAHELNPSARTWRGLGLSSFELRRYVDAIAQLEASLADPRKPLSERQRAEVSRLLARARQYVSVYRIRVEPSGAKVLVDGEPATLSDGALFLDPGKHTVVVQAEGYQEEVQDLKVDAGETQELRIELTTAGGEEEKTAETEPAVEPTPAPVAAPSSPAQPTRIWTWVLAGSSVAALGVGGGFLFATYDKASEYDACDPEDDCDPIADDGRRFQRNAIIGFSVAGALAAGAVTAFVLETKSATDARTSLLIGPNGLGVRHRF